MTAEPPHVRPPGPNDSGAPPRPAPPRAARRPTDVSVHGDRRIDDYAWLRQRDDPQVLAHLRAENAWTEAWMQPLAACRERLYAELLGRIQEDDEEVPFRDGGYWYAARTATGRPYPLQVRRRDEPGAAEELLLDLNALAEGKPFLELGSFEVSPDGRWLAYSLDETGALDYTLYVKDLATGALLDWTRRDTAGAVWANDNRTLFYLTQDEARRAHRVWRHTPGADPATPDVLVYEERNELFWVGLGKTRDHRFVVISSDSLDTSELRVIDADRPASRQRVVLPRRKGREAGLDHREGLFYLCVNDTGRNFRLVTVPVRRPLLAEAVELIAHRDDVMLEDIDLFARHLVVTERAGGLQRLRAVDLGSGESHLIALDDPVCTAEGGPNLEFDSGSFRLGCTSLVTPETVYDYDLAQRRLTLRKRQPVLGGYDPAHYASTQLMATAADGTVVPVSLVWRPDLRRAGPQPLLLEGYGAYGIPNDVHFSSSRLSLLDRGVVVALAHVRGGGDLGRRWHDEGKLGRKMNSFTDFIACAEALIAAGWTEPSQLIIEGGSAGGLLVGAATQLRPELFLAVVAEVPFLDVINTMLDETLPLTVGEYLEWGNPRKRAEYAWLRAYSPYDNLAPGDYPAMWLRTSLHDSQVAYWEAAKYVARLRDCQGADRPLLLTVNMDAGHGGASDRYGALRERAEVLAFMLAQWGLAQTLPTALPQAGAPDPASGRA